MVDSNGNAAAACYSEAVLQGLLELIERDSVALWWYPRTLQRGVDLSSFRCSYLDSCVNYHESLSRDLWALDITTDLGIPSFVALSRRRVGAEHIVLGFGAHPDAKLALRRAIAELNQTLGNVDARMSSRDVESDATAIWLQSATVESEYYLRPRDSDPIAARDYPDPPQDVSGSLNLCLSRLCMAGLEAFAFNLTRPDINLKVVKVLCPGLRHFWARFAPGRLYDVPVMLERIGKMQTEADLNPIPMFL